MLKKHEIRRTTVFVVPDKSWVGGEISTTGRHYMHQCPQRKNCFLLSKNDLLMVLKRTIEKMYCYKKYENCIRYKLYQEGMPVPKNLLPNDKECLSLEEW